MFKSSKLWVVMDGMDKSSEVEFGTDRRAESQNETQPRTIPIVVANLNNSRCLPRARSLIKQSRSLSSASLAGNRD